MHSTALPDPSTSTATEIPSGWDSGLLRSYRALSHLAEHASRPPFQLHLTWGTHENQNGNKERQHSARPRSWIRNADSAADSGWICGLRVDLESVGRGEPHISSRE